MNKSASLPKSLILQLHATRPLQTLFVHSKFLCLDDWEFLGVHPAAAAHVEAQIAERETQIYQATSAVTAREQANAATVLWRHARNATDIPGSSDLGRGGE